MRIAVMGTGGLGGYLGGRLAHAGQEVTFIARGQRLHTIRQMARKLDVPTPANDFLYACLMPYVNGRTPLAA